MLKTASLSIILRGVTLASKFALLLYLARFFSPAEIGLYGLITTTIGLFLILVGLDFNNFNARELLAHEPNHWARLIRDQFAFHGIAYIVILPLALIIFFLGILPWHSLFWFYLLLVLEHLSQETYRILITLSKPLTANAALFFRSGAWTYVLILTMFLYPPARDLTSLWIAWSVGDVVSVLIAVYSLRHLDWKQAFRTSIDWAWIQKGVKVSLTLLAGSMALRGIMTIDRYTLEYYWGKDSVGVYTFFSSIAFVLEIFVDTGITAILYPKAVAAYQQGHWQEFQRIMRQFTRAIIGVMLPLALGAVILIYPVLVFVQKPIYTTNLPVYWLLLLSAVVAIATRIPYYALYAQQLDRIVVSSYMVGLGVSVPANLLLVPNLGALGAVLATLSSMIAIGVVLGMAALRRRRVE